MKSNLSQARAASVPGIPELTRTPVLQAAERLRRPGSSWFGWTNPVQEYWVDACQRWLLTLDVLRQRGNSYLEQKKLISPAVLSFPVRGCAGRTNVRSPGELRPRSHRAPCRRYG